VVELLGDRLADEFVCMLVEDILKVFAGLEDVRRQVWVCAHPPDFKLEKVTMIGETYSHLSVWSLLIELEICAWSLLA
jgi:hypothetical protein